MGMAGKWDCCNDAVTSVVYLDPGSREMKITRREGVLHRPDSTLKETGGSSP